MVSGVSGGSKKCYRSKRELDAVAREKRSQLRMRVPADADHSN